MSAAHDRNGWKAAISRIDRNTLTNPDTSPGATVGFGLPSFRDGQNHAEEAGERNGGPADRCNEGRDLAPLRKLHDPPLSS